MDETSEGEWDGRMDECIKKMNDRMKDLRIY